MNLERKENRQLIFDLIVLVFIFFFLLGYFQPRYLFSKTITTGGDTASHYYTAEYLRDYLLPRGKVFGWCQGNLAGYPMLQYYFPLPFLLMAFLSWVIPLEIAFKIVTVLGAFLLPFAAYLFFRFLRYQFPVPIIGSAFTLAFLFNEANTMWGGNIPSILAGEFCFSIGLVLAVLWAGLMFRAVSGKRRWVLCGVLLALVGLSHAYPLLFSVFASSFFLLSKKKIKANLSFLFKVHTLAFSLMAFWLVPLLAILPNTTRFNILWIFHSWRQFHQQVLPVILYPFIGLMVLGTARALFRYNHYRKFEEEVGYLGFLALSGLLLYFIGYRARVVDIRFMPFFQFFLIVSGAIFFSRIVSKTVAGALLAGIVVIGTALWVDANETFIGKWIGSNYIGFENRPLWPSYSSVNTFLKGGPGEPRVVYEHSMIHTRAGTVRAFESLPLFSGRSTLEGLYIQASLAIPFIFYLQSEISQKPSTPIPDYNYSRFNLERGIEHLHLFNVRELIVAESETRKAVEADSRLSLIHTAGPYRVYKIVDRANRYVEPLKYRPVLAKQARWRRVSYKWFRLGDLSVPLVFADRPNETDEKTRSRFIALKSLDVRHLPRHRIEHSNADNLQETVKEEEVLITGAPVGHPVLIKIAYHPNWKVEGADRIYLASPAFMLIYPDSPEVRLYYGRTWPDYLGGFLTAAGLLVIIWTGVPLFKETKRIISRAVERCSIPVLVPCIILLGASAVITLFFRSPEFPALRYNKGIDYYRKKDYSTAKVYFKQVIEELPQTLISGEAAFHYAICFYLEKDWKRTILELKKLLEAYPETRRAAEAWYHIGLCHIKLGESQKALSIFEETILRFPESIWSGFTADRIRELRLP